MANTNVPPRSILHKKITRKAFAQLKKIETMDKKTILSLRLSMTYYALFLILPMINCVKRMKQKHALKTLMKQCLSICKTNKTIAV